jgi:SAM-dependent methyltransferase
VSVSVGNTYDKESTTNPVERRLVDGFDADLMALLPSNPARVLEVGCGEGNQLRKLGDALPGARLVGLDLAPPEPEEWRVPSARMVCGSVLALPYADRSFDLVLALEMLEHVEDPDAALAEIARVSAGTALLSVPWEPVWRAGNLVRRRYLGQWGNTPGHIQHFTRRGFLRLVGRHFHVEAVKRPLPWTMVRARARTSPW